MRGRRKYQYSSPDGTKLNVIKRKEKKHIQR